MNHYPYTAFGLLFPDDNLADIPTRSGIFPISDCTYIIADIDHGSLPYDYYATPHAQCSQAMDPPV
jgi:hypothetical protein